MRAPALTGVSAYHGLFGDMSKDSVPLIRIKLARKPVQALIDTGASGCIIDEDLCASLPGVVIDKTKLVRVEQASTTVDAVGVAHIHVRWAGGYQVQPFVVVAGAKALVILGRDFLRNAEIVPDMAKGTWFSKKTPGVETPFEPPMTVMQCLHAGMHVWTVRVEKSACTPQHWRKLVSILDVHKNTFQHQPGVAKSVKHVINTGDAAPIKIRMRPMTDAKRRILDDQLDELIFQGVIERSESPWASPIVIVTKKGGTYRLCGDFRALNAVTVADRYPMPCIDEIMARLGCARFFTTFDLFRGYLQVQMEEADKQKTAFQTHRGLWQFKVMPFGLRNAPATFQRLMYDVLGDAAWKYAMAYLYDIIIYSDTIEEHLAHTKDVLDGLAKAGLTVHPEKMQLCVTEITFLGHILSPGVLRPDPDKIRAVTEFPAPRNVKQVQQFLGLTGYYQRLVPSFSMVAKPLHPLLKKDSEWHWGEAQEKAMIELKRLLLETPGVALLDLNK